jgi:hypothetical protein
MIQHAPADARDEGGVRSPQEIDYDPPLVAVRLHEMIVWVLTRVAVNSEP